MKIKVTVRGDDRMFMQARVFKADRWYLDDHQNLVLKKGESDIAMIGSDHWVSVVVEEENQ